MGNISNQEEEPGNISFGVKPFHNLRLVYVERTNETVSGD